MKEIYINNIGDVVVCDFCNKDGAKVDGGVILGSYAICGECCNKYKYWEWDDYKGLMVGLNNDVKEVFQPVGKGDTTFKNYVLDYRERTTGSSNGISVIYKL